MGHRKSTTFYFIRLPSPPWIYSAAIDEEVKYKKFDI
jgi:hypothetical protein